MSDPNPDADSRRPECGCRHRLEVERRTDGAGRRLTRRYECRHCGRPFVAPTKRKP